MSNAQLVLDLLKAVNAATDKQLKVVATGKGVNLSFKIRKKKFTAPKITWTAAGSPRVNGKPVTLGNGYRLKAADFSTLTQRRKIEQVIRAAARGALLQQTGEGYMLNTGKLLPTRSREQESNE